VVRDLRPSSEAYSSAKWTAWGLRPIVLFASAYTTIGLLHEWTHALIAFALKVPSTLFHLYVHIHPAYGTPNDWAVIRVAGPLSCLAIGLVCWFVFRKAKGTRAELLLLYLAWFGIGTFFGNLMSTPFVGDFSSLALAFQLPMAVRYGVGLAGLLLLCGLAFLVGTELRKWAPAGVGRAKAGIGVIAIPAIVGTAIAILIFLPMSSAFAVARAGESTFWIFGLVGALTSRKQPAQSSRGLGLGWLDFVILLVAVLVVRVMVGGIAFVPNALSHPG
jgi:hypothetical protein